ncbi:hypothetical protein [Avibacterium paragallinarum]|uniref:Uncharacterized protein n=1 Tax=Avibacterium paragallinarum TaxID=728 RepID=A0A377ICP0_AVIPA|nr:hypothetical protein [Avibacterium paragallinarum]POY47804.1 hypothetical protein C3364_00010 [Avibacterium paragallinarum]RZN74609.1 hypothetical protein EC523_11905 [Avibacterium paragallinarum]CDF98633.1 Hypothetical protein AJF4211_003760 [Avibacterium paragallinarum JF4211]STO73013.1 Uncharacterised protein [Avibacterium paragallinarum]STO91859.1 Uncharacterised protein [Avibacterium paragallinarum]
MNRYYRFFNKGQPDDDWLENLLSQKERLEKYFEEKEALDLLLEEQRILNKKIAIKIEQVNKWAEKCSKPKITIK